MNLFFEFGPSLSISLSIRGRKRGREEGKRKEKPDTKALRRVFRSLDEHDASLEIVANQNDFRS